jgi:hypothetical protein
MQEIVVGNEVLEFPDEMGDDQIREAMKGYKAPSMGMGEMFSQAGSNFLPSAKQAAKDLVTPIMHPIQTYESVKNLGAGALQKLIPGEQPEEKYADAFGQFFADRYGSIEAAKETFAKDPVGFMSDASMFLTGGGTAVGKATRFVGDAVDPLQAVVKPVGAAAQVATGITSGVGPKAVYATSKAGNAGGAKATALLDNMRGTEGVESVVQEARDAVSAMKADASATYKADKAKWAKDSTTVLDWTDVNKSLDGIGKVRSFQGVSGKAALQNLEQSTGKVRLEVLDIVNKWQKLDPTEFHTVEGFDALKQQLGDLLDKPEIRQNPSSRRVVMETYDAIKKTIQKQSPSYAAAMQRSEEAIKLVREIETTLSLKKSAGIDAPLRKLQSILRNNANTNYGRRAEMGSMLEKAGATTLKEKLAGQMMSGLMPRGLTGQGAGIGSLLYSFTDPTALATLPLTMPRVVGEGAYYTGKFGAPTARSAFQAGRDPTNQIEEGF